jgi:hypothetical protein
MDSGYLRLARAHPNLGECTARRPASDALAEVTRTYEQAYRTQSSEHICVECQWQSSEHICVERSLTPRTGTFCNVAPGEATTSPKRLPR